MEGRKRVAIACQGGGSHTAFTAGVLKRVLEPDVLARHEVVGLSGTSGGAVCALLAWSALRADDPSRAATLLDAFWPRTRRRASWTGSSTRGRSGRARSSSS